MKISRGRWAFTSVVPMAKERMGTRDRLRVVDKSVQARLTRLRKRAWRIVQVAVAAGIAFWVAKEVLGHSLPFFAPIAVVVILALTGGDRVRRALEMSIGCVVGVLVGDLLFIGLGPGAWQITVAVAISLSVASVLSKSALVSNQVAIGSILIATIMPPGGETTGVDRTLDAIVGSIIGLITLALIPSSPLAQGRREAAKVLELASSVIDDVADGLRAGDAHRIEDSVAAVHDEDAGIGALATATRVGRESSQLSPLLWGTRRNVRSLERIVRPVENTIHNVRVLARRSLVLCEDRDTVSERQLQILDELADVSLALSDLFESKGELNEATEIPGLVNRLRILGAQAGMEVVEDQSLLSAYSILAQSRSLIADLLQVTGMSRESAVAVLAPTSTSPAYPPEIYEEDE